MPVTRRTSLVFLLSAAVASRLARADDGIALAPGRGSFVFVDRRGDPSKRTTVYTYLPSGIDVRTARVVFVMHGHGKDADAYRDAWVGPADRHGLIVVAPLFDAAQWPHGDYSYAGVSRDDDPSRWSFSLVEHLFDAFRDATGNQSTRYLLYGHSEGGQFVHRLVLLLPDARYERAVAANPGWYTMPTFDVAYPFGLADSPVTSASLAVSLGRELVVMLGDRDIDPNHPQLNRTPPAMAQGVDRFERGHAFYRQAEAAAAALHCPLAWRRIVVRGAAHQNRRMSPPAAEVLTA